MSKLGDILRAEIGVGSKYKLRVLDDNSAPRAFHQDSYFTDRDSGRETRYSKSFRGKWNTYHAAINELRVGRGWLRQQFPLTRALCGGCYDSPVDQDIAAREWVMTHTLTPAWNLRVPAWPTADVSTCPEEERLFA